MLWLKGLLQFSASCDYWSHHINPFGSEKISYHFSLCLILHIHAYRIFENSFRFRLPAVEKACIYCSKYLRPLDQDRSNDSHLNVYHVSRSILINGLRSLTATDVCFYYTANPNSFSSCGLIMEQLLPIMKVYIGQLKKRVLHSNSNFMCLLLLLEHIGNSACCEFKYLHPPQRPEIMKVSAAL